MSKQLAMSAAFAVFAMATFVLSATPDLRPGLAVTQTGATVDAAAPAIGPVLPGLSGIVR